MPPSRKGPARSSHHSGMTRLPGRSWVTEIQSVLGQDTTQIWTGAERSVRACVCVCVALLVNTSSYDKVYEHVHCEVDNTTLHKDDTNVSNLPLPHSKPVL